jgi:hypothetical protein
VVDLLAGGHWLLRKKTRCGRFPLNPKPHTGPSPLIFPNRKDRGQSVLGHIRDLRTGEVKRLSLSYGNCYLPFTPLPGAAEAEKQRDGPHQQNQREGHHEPLPRVEHPK